MTIDGLLLDGENHLSTTAVVLYTSGKSVEMMICNNGLLHYLVDYDGRTYERVESFPEPVESITFKIVAEV